MNNKIILTLTNWADDYESRTVISYTDPSMNDDINAIQDAAGNDAATFVLVGAYWTPSIII